MTSQPDPLHRLRSIDRDLLFFNADEQQHHLGLLTSKEHRQLQSMIKKVHQHIQKITNLQRTSSIHSSTASSLSASSQTNGSPPPPPPQQQSAAINDFFHQKQIKQLYSKLKVIKERYSVSMQAQQIRHLENDMERYQQLQAIHGLSGRLDVSSQLYDELQHLRHSLTSLRREWKLDRIQAIVSTLAMSTTSSVSSPSPSSSPASPISSLLLVPPASSSSSSSNATPTTTYSLLESHGHRWYPSVDKKWSSSSSSSSPSSSASSIKKQSNKNGSGGLVGVVKHWFRHYPLTSRIGKTSETTISTDNTAATTTTGTELDIPPPPPRKQHRRHHYHHFGQRSQPHQHLIHCSSQEEGRLKVQEIIHDFYRVFEENARQNEQRMHQLYARIFQQDVDPMLAEDMQRLCLAVSAAPPPSLASLLQPGLSSAFWTFCVTSETMRDSFLITKDALLDDMLFLVPPPPSSSSPVSSTSSRRNHHHRRNWVKAVWEKGITTTTTTSTNQRQQRKQKQPRRTTTTTTNTIGMQHDDPPLPSLENTDLVQHPTWSICLGLISEHLLYVGQQYYTKWIQQLVQAQHQQTIPFQVATETLASMYRALQIEQGHAILFRLCTQLESCLSS